ncbi:MAG TPA: RNA polymerase sigma factor [Candidatus Angelobacter sp.]|jgi:RNA polymerase sigma factor (sigma-70 family)|nr:RNA polymerase sigma factor [Candidatus Angelobacter sp.]
MDDNARETVLSLPTTRDTTAEDERLVQECLGGDERAWNTLIDKYKRLIYSVPVKYGFSPDEAGDIFQNVCIDLFTNLSKLRKIESLRSWLITVATHKCFHWKKQQKNDVELDAMEQEIAEEIASVPAVVMQEVQEEQAVRDAIGRLTPRCAQLVKLLFYEQPPMPYIEVAQKLGLATGSIGFIRGRCLNRLQKILGELGF